ncbi:MAG: Hsp33 family molecular chaperone HslO [Oscillospiraceae bacterium]
MGDYIVRAMSADGFVKAAAIRSTEIVRRGAAIQGTTTTATAAFGRALTATSLLGNMQKVEDGSVTLQIKGADLWGPFSAYPTLWATSGAMCSTRLSA